MHLARNLIQGGAAALLGGSVIGLLEALWNISTAGAPDLLSPLYAVVLYGLVALPFGVATGIGVTVLERILLLERLQRGVRRALEISEGRAFGFGLAGGVSPWLLFILFYNFNKVLYGEQGVPLTGLILIAVLIGVIDLVAVFALPLLLDGPLKPLLKGIGLLGAWGALVVATGIVAVLPVGDDPRDFGQDRRPVPEGMADKPDILYIMVDALRADHIGAYGLREIDTPNMDQLAADGVLFEHAYASATWTRASTASQFTSRSPSGHNADTKASRLSDDNVLWSEVLRDNGVVTGALADNINVTSTFGFDQGFDSFVYEAPAYPWLATESVFGLSVYKLVHKLTERVFAGHKVVEAYYQPADVVYADARAFIEANSDSRWALYVHAMEPHDPYFEHPSLTGDGPDYNGVGYARVEHEHPDPADTEYLKQRYRQEVEFYDLELGRFLDWLRETGRYDDLFIVLIADHGEEFHEHGGFWHGTTLYDELLHVPLIVKLPGNERAGTRVPWQVRLLDLAPTFTHVLGLDPDPSWEGHELLSDLSSLDPVPEPEPTVEGDEAAGEEAAADAEGAVGDEPIDEAAEEPTPDLPPAPPTPEECEAARAHPLDRPLVAEEDFEGNVLSAIQRGGFKYIRANAGNPRGLPEHELFDHVADRAELDNLLDGGGATCGRYPDARQADLTAELDTYIGLQAGTAAEGGSVEINAAECERLKALGYLSADEECGG